MNVSKSKISLVYFVVIIALLGLIGISSYLASKETETELNNLVRDVLPLNGLAEELLVNLINMETGLRGYEVSGDEKFLEPYSTGKLQLREIMTEMEALQKKYAHLDELMTGEVNPQIAQLETYYTEQLTLIQSGRKAEALQRVDIGKVQMDRFRAIHQTLKTEIERIGDAAQQSARDAGQTARFIIAAGGGAALIVGLFSALVFNRANRAEAALRKSEETYRYMAESLEAQNEEIIAQQEEQEATLEKLSERERELETINGYQEKLTGAHTMDAFLKAAVPALLQSLSLDAAMLVVTFDHDEPDPVYEAIYTTGYPAHQASLRRSQLHGPPERVLGGKQALASMRDTTAAESGFHLGSTRAVDRYFPLFNDRQEAIGFLLLTGYLTGTDANASSQRLSAGLIRQFGLAFLAQLMNEDRLRQAERLKQLNEQLQDEKGRIEEQRDLIENILESTHEGMVMCDPDGNVLFANRRQHEYMLLGTGACIVSAFRATLADMPEASQVLRAVEGLFSGQWDKFTERFALQDDEGSRHIELYATKVGDKRRKASQDLLFIFRDRTEEEQVDEMKNEFISIVSHELRTPLASVLGFIEILLHRELTPDKRQRYLQTIYKEANRLSTLINDFLDLQRMESGKQAYHFAPVELGALLGEAAEQWNGKQGHHLRLHLPPQAVWVRGDADRLTQVAHNLISNAVKYSPQAAYVDLTLRQEDGGHAVFSVQDYGLGIPDDAKDKLFSKFYRVDNSDRRQIGGTGLGLSIVREIVEAHGGSISFASAMGEGTTFDVMFDVYRVESADNAILVLEDDENLFQLIQAALVKLNLPIVHARSAEEGLMSLQSAKRQPPRLCIVDIHLEGIQTGWDFIGTLYRHPAFHATPVIVSTALEPPRHYHEKDSEKYLRKPFSMEKLLQVATDLLSRRDEHPTYVFPAQNEEIITATLEEKGITVTEIRSRPDHIHVEAKPAPPQDPSA